MGRGARPDAVHIPLGSLGASTVTNDIPIIAVCRSGRRSGKAAALLREKGVDVRNLSGGMQAWSQAGLPVVRDDGSPGVITYLVVPASLDGASPHHEECRVPVAA